MIMKILDDRLPRELTDMIFRTLHNALMKEICIIIRHKIVFVLVKKRLSFLICENQNYYSSLDVF